MYKKINKCRICGNRNLVPLVDLGIFSLTGIFPGSKDEDIGAGPLVFTKCVNDNNKNNCGLVQLLHNFQLNKLYGDNYGYRSGLNRSMVEHLYNKVKKIKKITDLKKGDIVIDIGSNDGTLLKAFPKKLDLVLIGIDPTGEKFKDFYPDNVIFITDFFPSKKINRFTGKKKAKIITSIAMFYDLEEPMSVVQSIYDALDDKGIWVFEQSYLPSMLATNSYDTICHEHLEYYTMKQIKYMMDKVGFKIIDMETNKVNGGSFSVTVAKRNSLYKEKTNIVDLMLKEEIRNGFDTLVPFKKFSKNIKKHKEDLLKFLEQIKKKKKLVLGYGASTKGNVILQYCGISRSDLPYIAEVNEDKFNKYTPGTFIPIISENQARSMKPDYFMVLPWHFKNNIIQREEKYLDDGGKLFFPLPKLEVYKM